MAFRKIAKQQTTGPKIDWDVRNKTILEAVTKAIEEEGPQQVAIISGLVDAGSQPPYEPYRDYPYEGSEQQDKLLDREDVDCYVEDGKFYIANRSEDSIIIVVDFPSVLVDYNSGIEDAEEEDLQPYRTYIGGDFKGVAASVALKPGRDGLYDAKSNIYALANATGEARGDVSKDFPLESLLGKVFCMDLTVKDGQFIKAKNIASKHKRIPVPEHNIEPFGLMLNDPEGYDELELKFVNSRIRKRLELAEEWEESDLKKALESQGSTTQKEESKESTPPAKEETPKKTKAAPAKKKLEPEDQKDFDFDDDTPPF